MSPLMTRLAPKTKVYWVLVPSHACRETGPWNTCIECARDWVGWEALIGVEIDLRGEELPAGELWVEIMWVGEDTRIRTDGARKENPFLRYEAFRLDRRTGRTVETDKHFAIAPYPENCAVHSRRRGVIQRVTTSPTFSATGDEPPSTSHYVAFRAEQGGKEAPIPKAATPGTSVGEVQKAVEFEAFVDHCRGALWGEVWTRTNIRRFPATRQPGRQRGPWAEDRSFEGPEW